MGKIIIGVHGLGNKPPKKILTEWWKKSIQEGLGKNGLQNIDFTLELVYWADVFYDQPLDLTISDPENPLYIDEIYTPSLPGYTPDPHPIRQKILDMLEVQLDRIFLNEDYSINFSFITDSIIHAYFRELDNYYAKECPEDENLNCRARDIIRKRTANVIKKYKGEDILVIGHSMGSIIAYDVLTFTMPEAEIDTFITIGSPLGLPVIMAKIAAERKIKLPRLKKLKSPPSLQKNWLNYSDLEDRIALIYNLTENYDANLNGVKVTNFVVDNDYSINGKRNPHKSFGYLRTPELSGAIYEFLKPKKEKFIRRVAEKIKDFVKPVFHKNKLSHQEARHI